LDVFPVYEGVGGSVEGVKNEGDIEVVIVVVDGMVDDRSRDGDMEPDHGVLVESHSEVDDGWRDEYLDMSTKLEVGLT
jgi:hypothetical protein